MTLKQEEENIFKNKGLFNNMGSTGVRDGDNRVLLKCCCS